MISVVTLALGVICFDVVAVALLVVVVVALFVVAAVDAVVAWVDDVVVVFAVVVVAVLVETVAFVFDFKVSGPLPQPVKMTQIIRIEIAVEKATRRCSFILDQ